MIESIVLSDISIHGSPGDMPLTDRLTSLRLLFSLSPSTLLSPVLDNLKSFGNKFGNKTSGALSAVKVTRQCALKPI